MGKHGSVDICMKQRQSVSDLDDSESNETDAGSIEMTEVLTPKRSRSTFAQNYDQSHLKFGFIGADEAGVQKPHCVVCGVVLSNDSIKPSNLKKTLTFKT